MMTVNEVSKLTGVSVRTLHYYDEIGLLHPTGVGENKYRLYDDTALERLQQILLFRELEFPLKDIKVILDSPRFDRNKALEQQIDILTLKKEHLDNLIILARGMLMRGVKHMDFSVFDTTKIDEYAKEAKESWGKTDAYLEFEEKTKNYTKENWEVFSQEMMQKFAAFGEVLEQSPESDEAQSIVKELQDTITRNCYTCTDTILASFGALYAGDGRFAETIDHAGGKGTAEFAAKAIAYYTQQ